MSNFIGSGNLWVVVAGWTSDATVTITDNLGSGSFVATASSLSNASRSWGPSNGYRMQMWHVASTGSGLLQANLAFSGTAPGHVRIAMYEFSGQDTTSLVKGAGNNSGTTVNSNTGNMGVTVPTLGGTYIGVSLGMSDGSTVTNGFSGTNEDMGDARAVGAHYANCSCIYNFTYTTGSGHDWAAVGATFREV
jgi:hypothetical protein